MLLSGSVVVTVPPGEASDREKTDCINQHEMTDEVVLRVEIEAHTKQTPNPGEQFKNYQGTPTDAVGLFSDQTVFGRAHKGTGNAQQGLDDGP